MPGSDSGEDLDSELLRTFVYSQGEGSLIT